MSDENKIIAIDFGSSHITLIAAEVVDGAQVRVLAVEESHKSNILRGGIIEQTSSAAYQVSELSKKLRNSLRLMVNLDVDIRSIYVSVNAKTMHSVRHMAEREFKHFTQITDALLAEIENECRKEFEKDKTAAVYVYDLIPLFYEIDGKRSNDPEGQKCYSLQATYNVIVGEKIIIDNINGSFDRTGITPQKYIPLSMEAIAEAILTPDECEDGTALINLGATTTTLALYANGTLENLTVVPLGSFHLTKDIQNLGISERNAEKLKRLKGAAMAQLVEKHEKIIVPPAQPDDDDVKIETPFLAHIIEARLDEILQPIFSVLEKNKDKIGAGIVLAGGGSNLNGILEFVQQRTDMITRFGDHSEKLTDDTDEAFANPVYAQIIGTCLMIDNYRRENPQNIEIKDPPTPKIKWKDKLAQGFRRLFDDDNPM
ncbi:MAG: cell division protein FtsA [Prevotellaceae bacterium]|nr:cell division protein FtsA [Prevotellaceae bacterium]